MPGSPRAGGRRAAVATHDPARPGWSAMSARPTPASGWSRPMERCCIRALSPPMISPRSARRSRPISARAAAPADAARRGALGDRRSDERPGPMTNHPWSFSVAALRDRLGFERFWRSFHRGGAGVAAAAMAADRMVVGGAPVEGRPIAVPRPGSGLGVSPSGRGGSRWPARGACHDGAGERARAENAVLGMRRRFSTTSRPNATFGPGSGQSLRQRLAALDRVPAAPYTAAQITDPETGASDPLCREATAMFCAMLGTFAGNFALTPAQRGRSTGPGGIVPRAGRRALPDSLRPARGSEPEAAAGWAPFWRQSRAMAS